MKRVVYSTQKTMQKRRHGNSCWEERGMPILENRRWIEVEVIALVVVASSLSSVAGLKSSS